MSHIAQRNKKGEITLGRCAPLQPTLLAGLSFYPGHQTRLQVLYSPRAWAKTRVASSEAIIRGVEYMRVFPFPFALKGERLIAPDRTE